MHRINGIHGRTVLVALILSGIGSPAAAAETFGYTSRKPQLWETGRPLPEQEPGTNLYWHDPFLGHREMCGLFAPASSGCPPSWYSRLELLALWREPKDSIPLATVGPLGPVALSTSDFRSEFDASLRALIGKTLGSWYRLEVSYFGTYSWDDRAAVRNLDDNDAGDIGKRAIFPEDLGGLCLHDAILARRQNRRE